LFESDRHQLQSVCMGFCKHQLLETSNPASSTLKAEAAGFAKSLTIIKQDTSHHSPPVSLVTNIN